MYFAKFEHPSIKNSWVLGVGANLSASQLQQINRVLVGFSHLWLLWWHACVVEVVVVAMAMNHLSTAYNARVAGTVQCFALVNWHASCV